MVKRGILYRIHMYFEGKRIWKAKMNVPLTIRIASDPERLGNQLNGHKVPIDSLNRDARAFEKRVLVNPHSSGTRNKIDKNDTPKRIGVAPDIEYPDDFDAIDWDISDMFGIDNEENGDKEEMIATLYEPFRHWSEGGSIYILSDLHFDDDDCKLMDPDWITPEEQIDIINKMVGKGDTFVCLGDVGNPKYVPLINARRKILLLGNHDSRGAYSGLFDEIYAGPLFIAEKILLSHEPVYGLSWCLNIHGHDHNNKEMYKEGCKHINLAANVCGYTPLNLGKLIKSGVLADIDNIHRETIDRAIENKKDAEIQKCKDEITEPGMTYSRGFNPSLEQWENIEKWQRRHIYRKHSPLTDNDESMVNPNTGSFRYEFEDTSLGPMGRVVCNDCRRLAESKSRGDRETYKKVMKRKNAEFFFGEV